MGDHLKYKQVRLNPDVRELLDAYKMDGESYSIAIGRLFKENDILRESQNILLKMAMKTPDSIALPSMTHRIYFLIMHMIKVMNGDVKHSDEYYFEGMIDCFIDLCVENLSEVCIALKTFNRDFPEHSSNLHNITDYYDENLYYKITEEGNDA